MKPEAERRPYEAWPNIRKGARYVGTGAGMRGYLCKAVRQQETSFGHKYAYVIWEDKVPPGVVVDAEGGSWVRTVLLDNVRKKR